MVEKPDYSEIVIPEGKDPKEYTYNERRAEILQLMERKGHPWGFNKSQLGRRYGVSSQQVANDFDRVKTWYRENIGSDSLEASDMAYRQIVQTHMDNGDMEKARRALDSWNTWLEDREFEEKAPERHEIEHEGVSFVFPEESQRD